MEKQGISAIVLARNEEKVIQACLRSLAWVNEIILIDTGSVDQTIPMAKKFGARIVTGLPGDFSQLRTKGKSEARYPWILYIDADERVSIELKNEILVKISEIPIRPLSYRVRRVNWYFGRRWPKEEWMMRLFYKDALIGWQGKIHETARIKGESRDLSTPILHNTHRALEQMLEKTNEWSTVEAELRDIAHHPPIVWWRLFRVMMTEFSDSFFYKRSYQVGALGWIESIYQMYSMFITYAKLWERQQSAIAN